MMNAKNDNDSLADLRRKAYAAFSDHESDMRTNPAYKKHHDEVVRRGERKAGKGE